VPSFLLNLPSPLLFFKPSTSSNVSNSSRKSAKATNAIITRTRRFAPTDRMLLLVVLLLGVVVVMAGAHWISHLIVYSVHCDNDGGMN
jgi:hypothetical protein